MSKGSLIFRQVNPGGRKTYIADCSMDPGANATIANAKLIAAAPELLAVAKRIHVLIESGDWTLPQGFHETEYAWLGSAIAQAEGTP